MAQAQASTKKTAKAPAKAVTNKVVTSTPKAKKISNKPFAQGVGRRKSAIARVWLKKGNGNIVVNDRQFDNYFTVPSANLAGKASFLAFPMTEGMTAEVNVVGGGFASQANAIQLGIARALLAFDQTLKSDLRKLGFITCDSRVKERKKYGQKAARAKFQFTKR